MSPQLQKSIPPDVMLANSVPRWALDLLCLDRPPAEGESLVIGRDTFVFDRGVLRNQALLHDANRQVQDTFGYKWNRRDTFESETVRAANRSWLVDRYGDMSEAAWIVQADCAPIVLDAGCGAAFSALELFAHVFDRIRYFGIDISNAIDVARDRVRAVGAREPAFMQSDLARLPIRPGSVDAIFSEGALHHTPSPEASLKELVRLLRPGGLFMFYVYRKKGPIREFTDDFLRERLRDVPPDEAWQRLEPLTRLGKLLGDLDIEIELPESIELLGIPAGRISLHRLFYWHVMKLYYRKEYTLDEMNHVNFDWYTPHYAHRQTPEQVRAWCAESGLSIEREVVELPGITILARRN
jgi:arsenite methyltransferase